MFSHGTSPLVGALVALPIISVLSAAAAEPEKSLPGDAMIERYLQQETERLSQRFLDGAKTRAEWEARKPRLRREYFDMLGLLAPRRLILVNAKNKAFDRTAEIYRLAGAADHLQRK